MEGSKPRMRYTSALLSPPSMLHAADCTGTFQPALCAVFLFLMSMMWLLPRSHPRNVWYVWNSARACSIYYMCTISSHSLYRVIGYYSKGRAITHFLFKFKQHALFCDIAIPFTTITPRRHSYNVQLVSVCVCDFTCAVCACMYLEILESIATVTNGNISLLMGLVRCPSLPNEIDACFSDTNTLTGACVTLKHKRRGVTCSQCRA